MRFVTSFNRSAGLPRGPSALDIGATGLLRSVDRELGEFSAKLGNEQLKNELFRIRGRLRAATARLGSP